MLTEFKGMAHFTPQRLQNSHEAREKKKRNFSYQKALSYTACVIATMKFSIASVYLQCGRSVRTYVCADLLSICEGSPSKRRFHGTATDKHYPLIENGQTASGSFLWRKRK